MFLAILSFSNKGGNGGTVWDDGAYDGVRKILVGRGGRFVSYFRFEYARGERMVPHAHGKRQEVPQEFVVNYPHEHIIVVEGTVDVCLTSIMFKTSTGRTSRVFGNVVGRKFVFEEKDLMLVGFSGRSADAIDALGASFGPLHTPSPAPGPAPVPAPSHGPGPRPAPAPAPTPGLAPAPAPGPRPAPAPGPRPAPAPGPHPAPAPAPGPSPTSVPAPTTTKIRPVGGIKGETFDDGVFDGVRTVTVGKDIYSITYIKIEYANAGKFEKSEHGTYRGEIKEFSVNYPDDYITAVGGSYNHIFNYDTTLVTSLYFTTSRGFTSPLFGEMKGTEFEFKGENGGKLLGFHGRAGHAIDAIGAYFDTGSKLGGSSNSGKGTDSGSSTQDNGKESDSGSRTQRLEAQGGKGGNQWDDGGDYDGVTKINVAVGRGIEQICFEYVKNGQTKEAPARGVRGRRSTIGTFEISHPNEYLLSVKGWSDSSNRIAGIQFKTNTKTSEYYGFEKLPEDKSTDILLEVKDKMIIGFHGFADSQVNSLGAYIAPVAN